jgi:methionyl-tRNA formyltransferase
MNVNVVFMGSPDFALPSLRELTRITHVAGVVTQPDRPAGRGRSLTPPPVKELAVSYGIPVIQPEKLRDAGVFEQLAAWEPDLIVVTAFGQILRRNVLDLPKFGCVNVHASLLPRWRGASPVQASILNGDAETGVTIMKMDAGLDTGDILAQQAEPIRQDDTAGSLSDRLAEIGAVLLVRTLPDYLNGTIISTPQDASRFTYAGMIKKEDGLLNFSETALALDRRVRAFSPWPGAFLMWQNAPFKIHRAHIEENCPAAPGEKLVIDNFPAVGTSSGCLVLDEVQPAGKKAMSGEIFLRGARGWMEA